MAIHFSNNVISELLGKLPAIGTWSDEDPTWTQFHWASCSIILYPMIPELLVVKLWYRHQSSLLSEIECRDRASCVDSPLDNCQLMYDSSWIKALMVGGSKFRSQCSSHTNTKVATSTWFINSTQFTLLTLSSLFHSALLNVFRKWIGLSLTILALTYS